MRTRVWISLLAAMTTLLGGCGARVDVGAETRRLLDDAITKLTNQSGDWRQVMETTVQKLPKDAQSLVRTELNDLLSRSISAAGSEIRCVIDFVGQRALHGLIRLRAQLLGQEAPLIRPTFCSGTPDNIPMADFNANPSRFPSIQVHGYDLDTQPEMQVLLTDNDGTVSDVTRSPSGTSRLSHQGHYKIVISLGANGVRLSATSQQISIVWNGGERKWEIPVSQPNNPPCRIRDVFLDSIGIKEVRASLDTGDPEFGVNRPLVSAGANLTNRGSHVDAEVWIQATEANNGDTAGSGRSIFTIHSAPTGWRVHRIVTPSSDTIDTYRDTTWEVDERLRPGNGPVSLFQLWGDTHGWDVEPERQDGTRVVAHFRRVHLEEIQATDCT
ncbi:hypothetical protein [Phytohabitans aurantiacus]|uniref:Uncharacterized protein n=1 Tax=Phytohabitans aurantiacus TaxID=3016789 RepID=A0ABQ5R533_9ACTN|nr:hypothetical protein [Phytohabitans aurantiacus]GLI01040.1 hypothetical protein Pa4123_63160 [Phytohabitans aurantiacus]